MITYTHICFWSGMIIGALMTLAVQRLIKSFKSKHKTVIPKEILNEPVAGVTEYNINKIKWYLIYFNFLLQSYEQYKKQQNNKNHRWLKDKMK